MTHSTYVLREKIFSKNSLKSFHVEDYKNIRCHAILSAFDRDVMHLYYPI